MTLQFGKLTVILPKVVSQLITLVIYGVYGLFVSFIVIEEVDSLCDDSCDTLISIEPSDGHTVGIVADHTLKKLFSVLQYTEYLVNIYIIKI